MGILISLMSTWFSESEVFKLLYEVSEVVSFCKFASCPHCFYSPTSTHTLDESGKAVSSHAPSDVEKGARGQGWENASLSVSL